MTVQICQWKKSFQYHIKSLDSSNPSMEELHALCYLSSKWSPNFHPVHSLMNNAGKYPLLGNGYSILLQNSNSWIISSFLGIKKFPLKVTRSTVKLLYMTCCNFQIYFLNQYHSFQFYYFASIFWKYNILTCCNFMNKEINILFGIV